MKKQIDDVSDAELVKEVCSGNTDAFNKIDRRYREIICRFLRRFTFGMEAAEELTQRTFIRAFEMIDQLQSGSKLAGWLHRIAFNFAAAEGRKKKTVSLNDNLNNNENIESAVFPVNESEDTEQYRNLWCIAKDILSDEEYKILQLRYVDDLPLPIIAEKLVKNKGTVRVQLHRARKKLYEHFQKINQKNECKK